MGKKFTDKQIKMFFWEADELPTANKAASLLGDISIYGTSRCKKTTGAWHSVWYEFDVYRDGDSIVSLIIELPVDFTLRDIKQTILRLIQNGGMLASNDTNLMRWWDANVYPGYQYDHAKYSALKFLEALRKRLITK